MKSKKMTYLLLVLSIVVWGTAGWKVYKAFHTEVKTPVSIAQVKVQEKDSISLLLNYRDPFLGNYTVAATTVADTSSVIRKPTPVGVPRVAEPEHMPDIQFKGIMSVGKNSLAVLQTGGRVVTLKTGEEVEGYKVTKVSNGKVVLMKGQKKYEIPVQ